jgi:hypothetical protein
MRSRSAWAALAAWAALGGLLVACGGRADGQRSSTTAGGADSGGASGSAAGAGAGGSRAPVLNDFDNEHSSEPGRPVPPTPAAFIWGTGNGHHIGNWFLTTDTLRDAEPVAIVPPRGDSTHARRAKGSGFASGAVLWAQLEHPLGRAVDLRPASGITFWSRLEGADSTLTVSLNDGARGAGSLEGRAALPSVVVAVDQEWRQLTVPFGDFEQADIAQVCSVEFFVGNGGGSFDLWIDDLSLLCPEPCR